MSSEIQLNTLRTACNLHHRFKSCLAYSELLSKEVSNSFLFVGRITIAVKGITLTMRIPPPTNKRLNELTKQLRNLGINSLLMLPAK